MSSKLSRSVLRAKYDRFVIAWNNEKRYQQFLLSSGQELEEGHARLGKKPNFKQWMLAMENQQVQAAYQAQQQAKQVEVKDTEWETV
jgi:hypothetical protein